MLIVHENMVHKRVFFDFEQLERCWDINHDLFGREMMRIVEAESLTPRSMYTVLGYLISHGVTASRTYAEEQLSSSLRPAPQTSLQLQRRVHSC